MQNLFLLVMFLMVNLFYAQDNSEPRTFEDLDTKLYKTHIIKFDTLDINKLKNVFKNITSTMFNNLKNVIVSETEDQIVLRYITTTKKTPSTSWNVRLIAQFKSGKIRLLVYDEGNVFIPSGQYTPTWNESSFYVNDNKRAVKKARSGILSEWMDNADSVLKGIENGMIKSINKTDNEW